jgi:uncharacterized protein Usg
LVYIKKKQIITIDIFYYRPDYKSLLQEFILQVDDSIPDLPRTHKFLNYWHNNIDAIIQEVILSVDEQLYKTYKNVSTIINFN